MKMDSDAVIILRLYEAFGSHANDVTITSTLPVKFYQRYTDELIATITDEYERCVNGMFALFM